MMVRLLASTILAAALTQGAAFAQDTSAKDKNAKSSASSSTMNQNAQTLPQELTQKLKSQGFTDVEVVPGSFLVSAKDKDGDPVSMVIGPHMTIFTAISVGDSSNTGSANSSTTSSSKNPSNAKK